MFKKTFFCLAMILANVPFAEEPKKNSQNMHMISHQEIEIFNNLLSSYKEEQPINIIFGSQHFCVTVCDSNARPFYRETIKTHPVWAPVRAYAIMREKGGSGYSMTGGECSPLF
jgi:hypothetical protein